MAQNINFILIFYSILVFQSLKTLSIGTMAPKATLMKGVLSRLRDKSLAQSCSIEQYLVGYDSIPLDPCLTRGQVQRKVVTREAVQLGSHPITTTIHLGSQTAPPYTLQSGLETLPTQVIWIGPQMKSTMTSTLYSFVSPQSNKKEDKSSFSFGVEKDSARSHSKQRSESKFSSGKVRLMHLSMRRVIIKFQVFSVFLHQLRVLQMLPFQLLLHRRRVHTRL